VTPTTPTLIKDAVLPAIRALVPSHTPHADKRWVQAGSIEAFEGGEIRTFHLENLVGEPGDITISGGWHRVYEMRIWTSYTGLAEEDDDSIIEEDAIQLGNAFVNLLDPTTNGLLKIDPAEQGWIEGPESEDGVRYGAHTFQVHYLADATV
jgi:hypothetical protein